MESNCAEAQNGIQMTASGSSLSPSSSARRTAVQQPLLTEEDIHVAAVPP